MEEEVSFTGVLKPHITSEQRISTCILCACMLLMLSTSLLYLLSSITFQHVSPPAYKSYSEDLSCLSSLFLTSFITILNKYANCCCIRCGPDEEHILGVVPREDRACNSGQDGESGRQHTLSIIPKQNILEFYCARI